MHGDAVHGLMLAIAVVAAGCGGDGEGDKLGCDEDALVRVWADADADGFGGGDAEEVCPDDVAEGQVPVGLDCNDDDDAIHPDAEEVCDGIDNDCDGAADPHDELVTWYLDSDGDGAGVQYPAQSACTRPGPEWVTSGDDCDDTNADVFPGQQEICNDQVDDDCDGLEDDLDPDVLVSTMTTWYADGDTDGYGDPEITLVSCAAPSGFVDNGDDCAPTHGARHPGSLEICNEVDDDCDDLVDDADPDIDPTTQISFFADNDLDGYGAPGSSILACSAIPGTADNELDCDDNSAKLNMDDNDNDGYSSCTGDCNDSDPVLTPFDLDGDAFSTCDPVPDCDPLMGDIYPGAPEVAGDAIDQDCDGVDDCYLDADGDTFGSTTVVQGSSLSCAGPHESDNSDDCDDATPGITEDRFWYTDADLDGHGTGATLGFDCFPPEPTASPSDADCNDADPAIHPDVPEICEDGIDQDCNPNNEACNIFFEDWEDGDYVGWADPLVGMNAVFDSTTAADGSLISLRLDGGVMGHYSGLSWTFADETPSEISFWVRTSSATGNKGYVVFGSNATLLTEQAVFFRIEGLTLKAYDGLLEYTAPASLNTWHHIRFVMDWAGQRYDYYADGTLVDANIDFRGTALTLQQFHLYNFNTSSASFDQIDLLQ